MAIPKIRVPDPNQVKKKRAPKRSDLSNPPVPKEVEEKADKDPAFKKALEALKEQDKQGRGRLKEIRVGRKTGLPKRGENHTQVFKVDWTIVDRLLKIQCTAEEVASIIGCARSTLLYACKNEKGMPFKDYKADKAAGGRASLRRKQWLLADKNPAMAIFLGKQILNQAEKTENKNFNVSAALNLENLNEKELDLLEGFLKKASQSALGDSSGDNDE